MACACLPDPDAALAELAEDYITQRYPHAPGRPPSAAQVSQVFGAKLHERFGHRRRGAVAPARFGCMSSPAAAVMCSPGRGGGACRWATGGAFLPTPRAGAPWAAGWSAWSSPTRATRCRCPLPTSAAGRRRWRRQPAARVLASCSIPFWLDAVHDIPGGPRGAYWDGGITDYHLHLDYRSLAPGLVLYPHFQPRWCPAGWTRPGSAATAPPPRWTTWCCCRRSPSGCAGCPAASCPTAATSRPMATIRRPHARLAPRAGRERSAWPTNSRPGSRAAHRGAATGLSWAPVRRGAPVYNAAPFPTHKGKKGRPVMTPRTPRLFFTET
jgi:hypothetical protein